MRSSWARPSRRLARTRTVQDGDERNAGKVQGFVQAALRQIGMVFGDPGLAAFRRRTLRNGAATAAGTAARPRATSFPWPARPAPRPDPRGPRARRPGIPESSGAETRNGPRPRRSWPTRPPRPASVRGTRVRRGPGPNWARRPPSLWPLRRPVRPAARRAVLLLVHPPRHAGQHRLGRFRIVGLQTGSQLGRVQIPPPVLQQHPHAVGVQFGPPRGQLAFLVKTMHRIVSSSGLVHSSRMWPAWYAGRARMSSSSRLSAWARALARRPGPSSFP
jgi:hypothetical protein